MVLNHAFSYSFYSIVVVVSVLTHSLDMLVETSSESHPAGAEQTRMIYFFSTPPSTNL